MLEPHDGDGMGRRLLAAPWIWAALALTIVLGWQILTVRANYAGNWTGLFRTGHAARLPPRLASTTFRNHHPAGYDGQFYRLLAHDPFLRLDTAVYLDSPLLRSRRILLPLLAWTLAGSHDGFIDAAYVAVVAGFIFLGAYFLARTFLFYGRHAAWGLLFLLVPATPIAVDSMTVDVAIAALTVWIAYCLATGRERGLWWMLAAACLVRETGVLLPAACALAALLRRDLRKAGLWITAALPALAWYGYLYRALPAAAPAKNLVPSWFYPQPKLGILLRTFDPPRYPQLAAGVASLVRSLDVVALLATLAMVVAGILLLRDMRPLAIRAAFLLYLGLLLATAEKNFWNTPYGYARPIVPLFVLPLVAAGNARQRWILPCVALLPALVDLRIGAEAQPQAVGVLRLLMGG